MEPKEDEEREVEVGFFWFRSIKETIFQLWNEDDSSEQTFIQRSFFTADSPNMFNFGQYLW